MALVRRIRRASCAVTTLLAGLARAEEPPADGHGVDVPSFRLVYTAPAGCPDRDAFVSGIRARTSRPRLVADEDTSATALRVVIETAPEGASGRLELRESDGTEETRSVASRTCAEVSNALALVAAVMLDPDAEVNGGPPSTSSTPAESPPPVPALPAPPRPPPSPTPSRVAPPPVEPWRFAAGAEIGMLGGIGPAVAPMGGAFGDVEHRWGSGLVSTVRLAVEVAATSSDLRTGSQTYEWLGATLRLCPAYLSPWHRLRAAACVGWQTAGLRGTTRDVRSPSTNLQLWLAPVASGTVEWALSRAVSLELDGGILFPLRQTRFFLAPNSTIFAVPAAAGTMAVGVRVRFL